jgi:hypothetical protein
VRGEHHSIVATIQRRLRSTSGADRRTGRDHPAPDAAGGSDRVRSEFGRTRCRAR